MQIWQCPIHNGTLEIYFVGDIVVKTIKLRLFRFFPEADMRKSLL